MRSDEWPNPHYSSEQQLPFIAALNESLEQAEQGRLQKIKEADTPLVSVYNLLKMKIQTLVATNRSKIQLLADQPSTSTLNNIKASYAILTALAAMLVNYDGWYKNASLSYNALLIRSNLSAIQITNQIDLAITTAIQTSLTALICLRSQLDVSTQAESNDIIKKYHKEVLEKLNKIPLTIDKLITELEKKVRDYRNKNSTNEVTDEKSFVGEDTLHHRSDTMTSTQSVNTDSTDEPHFSLDEHSSCGIKLTGRTLATGAMVAAGSSGVTAFSVAFSPTALWWGGAALIGIQAVPVIGQIITAVSLFVLAVGLSASYLWWRHRNNQAKKLAERFKSNSVFSHVNVTNGTDIINSLYEKNQVVSPPGTVISTTSLEKSPSLDLSNQPPLKDEGSDEEDPEPQYLLGYCPVM